MIDYVAPKSYAKGGKMIKLLGRVPNTIAIALSGGSDSMAALDFLSQGNRRKVVALYFNHGTGHSDDAEYFVKEYCLSRQIPLVVGRISRPIEPRESKEAYWRSERYRFFDNWITEGEHCNIIKELDKDAFFKHFSNVPILTCHHLDDAVETWIFTSLNGTGRLIPYSRDNFLRPFLTTRKEVLTSWCNRHNVPFVSDPSNNDTSYMRNFIRHELMPKAIIVNPGIYKVIKKKLEASYKDSVDIF